MYERILCKIKRKIEGTHSLPQYYRPYLFSKKLTLYVNVILVVVVITTKYRDEKTYIMILQIVAI